VELCTELFCAIIPTLLCTHSGSPYYVMHSSSYIYDYIYFAIPQTFNESWWGRRKKRKRRL